ncbi:MAG: hypothetical protein M1409_02725 [Actinobacteria bacterium]|nr:hypothetical protein [Actinomycetota bacterium]
MKTVTPLSKTLALILFILLPVLAFFLGRIYQKTIYESTQTSVVIPSNATILKVAPTITSQTLNNDSFVMANSDKTVTLNPAIKTHLTIPKGASYQIDANGWGINIRLSPNILIEMCAGCQQISLFNKCGQGYGMSGEGICSVRKITLSNIVMNANVLKNDPNYVMFIDGQIGPLSIGIETNNKKLLTYDEEATVNKLLTTIKTEQ